MKRKQSTTTQQRKRTQRECELGENCPYKNELQHRMEYVHNLDAKTIEKQKSFASKGIKLGGSSSSGGNSSSSGSSSGGFGGSGVRLGGSATGASWLVNQTHTYRSNQSSSPSIKDIFCEKCFKFFPPTAYSKHAADHAAEGLRAAQDAEYENSILADIQKQEAIRAEELKKKTEERKAEEQAALASALAESKKISEERALKHAVDNLLPEPDGSYEGRTVRIRFTIPSGSKFVRLFRSSNTVQDAFGFLMSIAECRPYIGHCLRDAVGSVAIKYRSDHRCFDECGLTGSCSLLLAPTLGNNDDNEEEKGTVNDDKSGGGVEYDASTSRDSSSVSFSDVGKGVPSTAGSNVSRSSTSGSSSLSSSNRPEVVCLDEEEERITSIQRNNSFPSSVKVDRSVIDLTL